MFVRDCLLTTVFVLQTYGPRREFAVDGQMDRVCAIFNLREPFANLSARQRLGSHFKGRLVGFMHCLMDHRRHQRTHREGGWSFLAPFASSQG